MLDALKGVVEGDIVAIAYRPGHFLHQNAGVGQHGAGHVHPGFQHVLMESHAGFLANQGGEIVGADAQLIRYIVELNALDGMQVNVLQGVAGQKGLLGRSQTPEKGLVQLLQALTHFFLRADKPDAAHGRVQLLVRAQVEAAAQTGGIQKHHGPQIAVLTAALHGKRMSRFSGVGVRQLRLGDQLVNLPLRTGDGLLPRRAVALLPVKYAGAAFFAQSRFPQGAPGLQVSLTDGVAALPQSADADAHGMNQLVQHIAG